MPLPFRLHDHTQSFYLYCCSSVSSWVIRDWSSGTDWACSWMSRTLSSPKLRASLASSARRLIDIIQNDQTALSIIYPFSCSNLIQLSWKIMSYLIWAFSFFSADSTPRSLWTSWYAHCNSSSRRLLNLMASSSCPSREERRSFSSLRRGSLMSRLLTTLLSPSPGLLHCPLILCVGSSFPWIRVMEVVGRAEAVQLKLEGFEWLWVLSRRRATSKARQRASLPCSAERRSSTSSLRAATSSGEERRLLNWWWT